MLLATPIRAGPTAVSVRSVAALVADVLPSSTRAAASAAARSFIILTLLCSGAWHARCGRAWSFSHLLNARRRKRLQAGREHVFRKRCAHVSTVKPRDGGPGRLDRAW